ncbi:MAG: hypothetical protein CR997_00680 [Acidobacteria bacterium]|nr:MAG: hypothetical protein CR997_00680 [Acidobacteriota bacterium]
MKLYLLLCITLLTIINCHNEVIELRSGSVSTSSVSFGPRLFPPSDITRFEDIVEIERVIVLDDRVYIGEVSQIVINDNLICKRSLKAV